MPTRTVAIALDPRAADPDDVDPARDRQIDAAHRVSDRFRGRSRAPPARRARRHVPPRPAARRHGRAPHPVAPWRVFQEPLHRFPHLFDRRLFVVDDHRAAGGREELGVLSLVVTRCSRKRHEDRRRADHRDLGDGRSAGAADREIRRREDIGETLFERDEPVGQRRAVEAHRPRAPCALGEVTLAAHVVEREVAAIGEALRERQCELVQPTRAEGSPDNKEEGSLRLDTRVRASPRRDRCLHAPRRGRHDGRGRR